MGESNVHLEKESQPKADPTPKMGRHREDPVASTGPTTAPDPNYTGGNVRDGGDDQ